MTATLSLDTILSEFDEKSEAWVLQDRKSKKYVTIPHPKYPKRIIVHFFLSKVDAELLLTEILDVNWAMRNRDIFPISVKLIKAINGIAADKTIGNADGFVVHSPNEVFDFLKNIDSK